MPVFKRILVPVDGSAHAEHVLPDAARLARASGSTILLVRVMRPLIEHEIGHPSPGIWLPAADTALRDAASAYLAELRQSDPLQGISTEAHILVGPAASMIVQAAVVQHADIIVMSSRARRGLSRWMLGSVAGAVVRDAHVPVLVRRDIAAPMVLRLDDGQAFSALVPLDGSPLAEAALAPAVQLVAAMSHSSSHASGGSVHLLRVVEPSPHHPTEQSLTARREHAERRRALRRELREAREYLDAAATLLRERCADALGVSVS